MYFMSDPQALHVTRNVIPGKLGVDLHLHRVHIPLVTIAMMTNGQVSEYLVLYRWQLNVMLLSLSLYRARHIGQSNSSTRFCSS